MRMIEIEGLAKSFTLHLRESAVLPVLRDVAFTVSAGECVVLGGASGMGKSSMLRMIFGNYAADAGRIMVRDDTAMVDVTRASPREIVALRKRAMSYVSQFLRVIPRVGSADIVTRAGVDGGLAPDAARHAAEALLRRLDIAPALWRLPPATFSGGEQQRINLARSFVASRPIMLLDEPTASLDATNRRVVIELIGEAKQAGAAILGIFHDDDVRAAVASRIIDLSQFKPR